eukprot:jgi/Tetstr1/437591/TSEL_026262.t1
MPPPPPPPNAGRTRSSSNVIRGVIVVVSFAAVTLLAGHERMEVSPGGHAGKGHLHHSAGRRSSFETGAYNGPAASQIEPQRAQLLGHQRLASVARVNTDAMPESIELQQALGGVAEELDALMLGAQRQQAAPLEPSRYERRDAPRAAGGWNRPSTPLRGSGQVASLQVPVSVEVAPVGTEASLLQRFENNIASMAGGWHVSPPAPQASMSAAMQSAPMPSSLSSPRVAQEAPRQAAVSPKVNDASPRSPRTPRTARSPRPNPNSPRQLSEDEIEVKLRNKPFSGDFILNAKNRKPGDMLKQPKHLSAEGQRRRMERGKVAAASRTMKWEHIGTLDKLWLEAGVVPPTDEIRSRWLGEGAAQRSATCAVVGNGGGLLGMAAGPEIDKHDIVIRFNGGPVNGFQRYVGSKTTFRLTNYDHFAFSDAGDEIILQHMTNVNGTKAVTRYSKSMIKKRANGKFGQDPRDNIQFRVIDPDFHYMMMELFKYGAPSNGLYGVTLAGEICASVTMFGFQKVWKGTKMPYHYYNDVEPNDSQFGRDNNEAIFFRKWLDAVNLQAAGDADWVQWKSTTGWPHQKFMFAEERFAGRLPRLEINLDTVPWVKTGWNLETPNPEYVMSAREGSSPREVRLSH